MGIIDDIMSGNIDEVDLLEYVISNDLDVAIAAASCKVATETILDIAAQDSNKNVRRAAIMNPNIGDRTMLKLCSDIDIEISELAKIEWERRNK